MTDLELRDHFAAQAITGVLGALPSRDWKIAAEHLAEQAYTIAEAMIRARELRKERAGSAT